MASSGASPPDFGWPHRVAEAIFEWLEVVFEDLLDRATEVSSRPILGAVLRAAVLSGVVYLVILWACFCYLHFPISPYTLSDFVVWVFLATGLIWGALAIFLGVAQFVLLLWLILLVCVYFALSLFYLCYVIGHSIRMESHWLKRYRSPLFVGMASVLLLATFVDGSWRFWDRPFEVYGWVRLVLVGVAAWAALFCRLVRDKVEWRETPLRVVVWTVGAALIVGVLVYWQFAHDRPGYLLRKHVVERPQDVGAWLDLASHYKSEGDTIAGDLGDEDHSPGDPTPYYSEALECMNRAVKLGAAGFEVQLSRAQLADAVG